MKRGAVSVALVLLLTLIPTSLDAQSCRNWGCFRTGTFTECKTLICPSYGCNPPARYAVDCEVVCDDTGCWCHYGVLCYDI